MKRQSPADRRLRQRVGNCGAGKVGSFKHSELWNSCERLIGVALKARLVIFQSPASFNPPAECEG